MSGMRTGDLTRVRFRRFHGGNPGKLGARRYCRALMSRCVGITLVQLQVMRWTTCLVTKP